ncbi:MAG: hypothetical protein HY013_02875 [Candidatus Solibacter usitatus]|nr:hypothetical protein [Candidatus Solibacter usitatus]
MRTLALLLAGLGLAGAAALFPLDQVKPGLRGAGKTVFQGGRIEEFQVEILGLMENVGPKQSLILARLSGGPIAQTGVLQGMSGSPVYIDGKLLGAVAMAFPFSKEPIAGIRPIGEMLAAAPAQAPPSARVSLQDQDLLAGLPKPMEAIFGASRLLEISTPVSFGGFTRQTIERFAPQLRALGMEPVQGVSAGSAPGGKLGDPKAIQPGSMISVHLVTGDFSVGADGTVTHVDGDRVYAFGHRLLAVGSTELPFARAEVLALLPSLATSFKISASREMMGTISQDRSTALSGLLGRRAAMVPVSIAVGRATYRMEMVNERFLSPFLLQIIAYSAIDATERTVGTGSFAVRGEFAFAGHAAPVRFDNVYAADSGAAMQAATMTAIPLAYLMQGGFDALRLKEISLRIEPFDQKRQWSIDQVYSARPVVRPGETVDLNISLAGENGQELVRRASFRTPPGLTPGPLFFTVSDAMTRNLTELRPVIGTPPRSAQQMVAAVNNLKTNTRMYVRVWRPEPSYQLQGADLPSPPPSLHMLLARALTPSYSSKLAELEIEGSGAAITGSKSVTVEVKE